MRIALKIALLLTFLTPVGAEAQSTMAACLESNATEQAIGPIRSKIGVGKKLSEFPFNQLTDTTTPTPTEKEAIARYATYFAECVKLDAPARKGNLPPDAAALLQAFFTGTVALAASLYSGDITYGQFNKERVERASQVSIGMASIRRRENARANAEEQARLNTLLQLLSTPRPALPNYQPVSPAPVYKPPETRTTDCFSFGFQTTCTTTTR